MQIFDVFTKKVYEKEGEQRIITYKAGALKITDRGNMYLRLFHIPNIDFYVRERDSDLPTVNLEE